MKSRFILFCVALTMSCAVSCTDDNQVVSSTRDSECYSSVRSVEDAIIEANKAASIISAKSRGITRSASDKVFVIANHTASRGEGVDTLMYIVEFDDNQGYAIVAAPKAVEDPIIGVIDEGSYEEESDNDNFNYFMELSEEYILSEVERSGVVTINPSLPLTQVKYVDRLIVDSRLEPKLEVCWGQHWPEGEFCPNDYCGCVTTAVAQILSFFEQPTSMTLTYDDRDMNSITINWPLIKQHKVSSASSFLMESGCSLSGVNHQTIGRMCRQIAELLGASFEGDEGTKTNLNQFPQTISLLLPQQTLSSLSFSNWQGLVTALDNGLLLISGDDMRDVPEPQKQGHSWLADGYVNYHMVTDMYTKQDGQIWQYVESYDTYKRWLHYNWGWGGNNNGYFAADVATDLTSNAKEFDQSTGNLTQMPYGNIIVYSIN